MNIRDANTTAQAEGSLRGFDGRVDEPSGSAPVPSGFRLTATPWVDYEVTAFGEDGGERSTLLRVKFPEEARATLETMSWNDGDRVVDTLVRIGAAYVVRHFASGLTRRADGETGAQQVLEIPLSFFLASLDAVGRLEDGRAGRCEG